MTDELNALSRTVELAGTPVGDGHPPVFLAEIGALFNQDVDEARTLLKQIGAAARDDGLPLLLKGEILHDVTICLDDGTIETYQSRAGERKTEPYRKLIERKALSLDTYRELLAACRAEGLSAIVSVYEFAGADFAAAEGVAALKIASSNITHLPLIRHVASTGLPMMIDNGRASLAETDRAIRHALDAGCTQVIIEHSQDGHPAPPANHNLRSIQTMKQIYQAPVGLSDHSVSEDMMFVALGLGANLIERNISADPYRLEQDTAFSSGAEQLADLLVRLKDAWIALGRPFRDPRNRSGLIATSSRMGLVARRDVKAGERADLETITFAFPCHGIGAEHFEQVEGWAFVRDVCAGEVVNWHDLGGA